MSIFYLLTFIVCAGYIALITAYLTGWKKTKIWDPAAVSKNGVSVYASIILPVRNEEKNISYVLDCLRKQNYPHDKFEIIIVNDHSSDKTVERALGSSVANLRMIHLPPHLYGKKSAIAEGVKAATGKLIITSDADCEMNENWLFSIMSFYETFKPKMIVAPVLLKGEKKFSEIVQGQEMSVLGGCACGSLYYDRPILCSGANLAYEREAFFSVSGFENVDHTLSGDDIFLLQKMYSRFPGQIRYLKSADGAVYTTAENSYDAIRQRRRWASKTFRLGLSHTSAVAVLVFATNFSLALFMLVLVAGVVGISPVNVKFALALVTALLLKSIFDYMLLHAVNHFFGKKNYPLLFLLAALLYPVYATAMGIISPFSEYSWKGRRS